MATNKPVIRQSKAKGQVFLISYKHIQKIANAVDEDVDAIIEIGPGKGAITGPLLNKGALFYAIELDKRWSDYLTEKYSDKTPNFNIITDDFLKFDLVNFINNDLLANHNIYVVSNLPYSITAPILFKLYEAQKHCKTIKGFVLMMQKEVGERIVALPDSKKYNFLTVVSQFYFDIKVVGNVNKKHFKPVPKVDSIVLKFTPRAELDAFILEHEDDFFKFVKRLFIFRRKTILNNLIKIVVKREDAIIILASSGINQNKRAENLSIAEFRKLYEKV